MSYEKRGGLPCYLHVGLSDFFEVGNSRPGKKEYRLLYTQMLRARLVTLTHATRRVMNGQEQNGNMVIKCKLADGIQNTWLVGGVVFEMLECPILKVWHGWVTFFATFANLRHNNLWVLKFVIGHLSLRCRRCRRCGFATLCLTLGCSCWYSSSLPLDSIWF